MASAKEYEDYINKMRGLRAQRDAGTITQEQAVAQQPKRTGTVQSNNLTYNVETGANQYRGLGNTTLGQVGKQMAETWREGGIVGSSLQIGRNIEESLGLRQPAAPTSTPTTASAQPVVKPTASVPSRAPMPIDQQIYGTDQRMMPPEQRAVAAQLRTMYPSAAGMTKPSTVTPQTAVQGVVNAPTAARAALKPGEFTAMYNGKPIGGNAAEYAANIPAQGAARPTFANTGAAQNAKAAEEYRAFMARSQANADRFMERDNATRPRAGESQSARRSRVASEASAAADAEARKTATAENAADRALERDKSMTAAKAQVEAAAAGKPDAKAQDAALLKEYVAAWSLATEEEKPALMEKIMALGGGGTNATTKPVAKDKDGKEVFLRNGKYVYADGTEYKAA